MENLKVSSVKRWEIKKKMDVLLSYFLMGFKFFWSIWSIDRNLNIFLINFSIRYLPRVTVYRNFNFTYLISVSVAKLSLFAVIIYKLFLRIFIL